MNIDFRQGPATVSPAMPEPDIPDDGSGGKRTLGYRRKSRQVWSIGNPDWLMSTCPLKAAGQGRFEPASSAFSLIALSIDPSYSGAFSPNRSSALYILSS